MRYITYVNLRPSRFFLSGEGVVEKDNNIVYFSLLLLILILKLRTKTAPKHLEKLGIPSMWLVLDILQQSKWRFCHVIALCGPALLGSFSSSGSSSSSEMAWVLSSK